MQYQVQHEEQGQRGEFFIQQDGRRIAEMTYRRHASIATIDHTEVDMALRGGGVARKLVDSAVAWARSSGVKLRSTCSYASAVLARDASLRDVLAD